MQTSSNMLQNQNGAAEEAHNNVQPDMPLGCVENFLTSLSNTSLVVSSTSLYRTLPPNDALFTHAHTAIPWKNQGDIVFICSEGKIVRAHRILLLAVLPNFVNDLMKIQALIPKQCDVASPQLPIFAMGVEDKCVKNFLTLLNQSNVLMTGSELLQLKNLIEVLGIRELSVYVQQPCIPLASVEHDNVKTSSSFNIEQQDKRVNDIKNAALRNVSKRPQNERNQRNDFQHSILAELKTGNSADKFKNKTGKRKCVSNNGSSNLDLPSNQALLHLEPRQDCTDMTNAASITTNETSNIIINQNYSAKNTEISVSQAEDQTDGLYTTPQS